MAQSRLEKIGTIFTRVSGLLRSGAMKPEDKPLWYDVYAAFPPKLEPRFDRPAPQIPIRNIFYEEDQVRAKFHKSQKQAEMVSMFDRQRKTQSQQFIQIYQGLKSQGALDEEKIFETALDLLQEQRAQMRQDAQQAKDMDLGLEEDSKQTLSESFTQAKADAGETKTSTATTSASGTTNPDSKSDSKNKIAGQNKNNKNC
ncbi:small ribosomal subunit protein mS23 [Musca vetustissima]|uniref:small ribosomal subunit protein mS23 n=1 Tax=Musca vetustissima TaxID=27455 RepID=UPI002AB64C24|nr:small ribosomal subunit protein mS23 [Musca vetustissima]